MHLRIQVKNKIINFLTLKKNLWAKCSGKWKYIVSHCYYICYVLISYFEKVLLVLKSPRSWCLAHHTGGGRSFLLFTQLDLF